MKRLSISAFYQDSRSLLLFLFGILFSMITALTASAEEPPDEGMWLPILIERLNYVDMQKIGLHLTPEEIYSVNHSSLKDAIVGLSSGPPSNGSFFCTAFVVSDQGLIFTNHHCGYSAVQNHSTPEHDYLTDGFWARSLAEELPNEGMCASFLVRIENVTDSIIPFLPVHLSESDRSKKIREISSRITKRTSEDGTYNCRVTSFYSGNEYYLFVWKTYTDVRLVGAPPSSIGKFGGDTDNWMWPRHTGDFTVLRIYANSTNKPADYSNENVPLKPAYHLPISLAGVEKNEFAMIWGYPGSTSRYLTSYGIEYNLEDFYPVIIDVFGKELEVMKARMDVDKAARIAYAENYASLSNNWKSFIGQTNILQNNQVIKKRQQLEAEFTTWVNTNPLRKERYGNVLSELQEGYKKLGEQSVPFFYSRFAGAGLDIVGFANGFSGLKEQLEKNNKAATKETVNSLRPVIAEHFKELDFEIEKNMFGELLKLYAKKVKKEDLPSIFGTIDKDYGNDYMAFASAVYTSSVFATAERANAFLDKPSLKVFNKDLGWLTAQSMQEATGKISVAFSEARNAISRGNRLWIDGLRDMLPNQIFYPDANSTLRLSYGCVTGSTNNTFSDDKYYTTLSEMILKENPQNPDFSIPLKLKELYQNKDFGIYYPAQTSDINVCFLTNNDITGGNSGSPVLNGDGYVTGITFDNNWEGMAGDISYDPIHQRSINVDIRFVLFIIDKFADASNIIQELNLVVPKPVILASASTPTIQSSSNLTTRTKPTAPPVLPASLHISTINLIDPNNNKIIEATEQVIIFAVISNIGEGIAKGVRVDVSEITKLPGMQFPSSIFIGDIPPNQTKEVKIPINALMSLPSDNAEFLVQFREQSGFDSDPLKLAVKTKKFDFPDIEIVDYKFYGENGENIRLGVRSKLEVLIQNLGFGNAEKINVCFLNPGNVFPASDTSFTIDELRPNDTKKITYEFFTNKRYNQIKLPITVLITEKYNERGKQKVLQAYLENLMAIDSRSVVPSVPVEQMQTITISEASLTSPVDKISSVNATIFPKRIALIFGNEDYTRFQRTLSTEMNVSFAANDANTFKEYAKNVLGVDERNIFFEINATAGIMSQKIDLVIKLLEKLGPEAELIFYYAGHGQPDETTRIPYLIPVDVSASNLSSAIRLSDLYKKLAETNAYRITIFLDACFSGGGRQSGLLAARSVKVKPVEDIISGNIIVFSASSGDQSALPFNDKNHGLFTYFLLKQLKDSQGKVNYSDLFNYLKDVVSIEALRTNNKEQDPQVQYSIDIEDRWGNWSFQ